VIEESPIVPVAGGTTLTDGTIVAERIMFELKKENFSTVPS